MKRLLVLLYGVVSYACFLGIFLYALGFVGGLATPTRLDGPLQGSLAAALAINAALISLFALQHSLMARPRFKSLWTRFVPAPIERSTYVLFTNLALALLFWQWRPIGGAIWDIQQPLPKALLWALFACGWITVLITTFLINHFDLFGLRQVWLYFRGQKYSHLPFATPGPYRFVRHPLYVGWLIAFWATPTMTAAHLLFALGMSAYMLAAIQFEERDLVRFHPDYAAYRERTPMLIPRFWAWPARRNDSRSPGRRAEEPSSAA